MIGDRFPKTNQVLITMHEMFCFCIAFNVLFLWESIKKSQIYPWALTGKAFISPQSMKLFSAQVDGSGSYSARFQPLAAEVIDPIRKQCRRQVIGGAAALRVIMAPPK